MTNEQITQKVHEIFDNSGIIVYDESDNEFRIDVGQIMNKKEFTKFTNDFEITCIGSHTEPYYEYYDQAVIEIYFKEK